MSPDYNTPKYVWTDFGGVLTPPVSHTMRVFCQKYGLTESQLRAGFEAVARNHNLTDPLELVDTPLMSEKEWLSEISEQVGGAFQLDTLADDWFRDREPNASWVAYLHEIKAHGVKVGLISNMVPTWDNHWRAMLNEPDLFDDIVLSFEVGRPCSRVGCHRIHHNRRVCETAAPPALTGRGNSLNPVTGRSPNERKTHG